MADDFETNGRVPPGFRLQALEVCNWGTFDSTAPSTCGRVYSLRPEGQTALLIGQNGSGKSTLVDALLTLLVQPPVRNYNVAAGALKRERTERTYIQGAYGRFSREEDNRADVQYLRPSGRHYSILLACFRNAQTGRALTIAQVLYLDGEGQPKKIYCLAPAERSIAADCAGLTGSEKLKQQMQRRGFRVTTTWQEFHEWFRKATGVQPKAMDMFNQTVAVKDIQRLNDFIRKHMLEAKPWGEKVDRLLRHFAELSDAHQALLRVRKQFELLEPIAELGAVYRAQAEQLERTVRLLGAADSFFRQKTVDLFTPACEARQEELRQVREQKQRISEELGSVRDQCRRLQNEIEQAGGERLRTIPLLIRNHEAEAKAKREADRRFHEALRSAGLDISISEPAELSPIRERLPQLLAGLEHELADQAARHTDLVVQRADLIRALREHEHELNALQRRQGNLPESLAEMRRQFCEELRLPEKELPFAAELMSVHPDARAWECSIEMVLRSFALSLLVPERHYALVSNYFNHTRLKDGHGRGQRLVYLRVGARSKPSSGPAPHPQSLLRKLDFRDGSPLLPWVKAELEERFDYRCCDTMEEFQQSPGPAMTRERHIKSRGGTRHEKDDRDRISDPRYFVLGWDNRQKQRRLAEEIRRLQSSHEKCDAQVVRTEAQLQLLRERKTAAQQALEVTEFAAIDYRSHEHEIASLKLEKQALEDGSDAVRLLKQRLAQQQAREQALQATLERLVGDEREHENWIGQAQRLMENARTELERRRLEGTLQRELPVHADLDAQFTDAPLTVDDLVPREAEFIKSLGAERDRRQKELEPVQTQLTTVMGRFLTKFPEERPDLAPSVLYLDGFVGLLDHIRNEDLPQHEQRFKQRLNEKVTHEIGLLNGALQTERSEIEDRIDMLNASLRQLEYRPGTHMRLEARAVRDREVAEFRNALAECLAGTFEGSLEADEARYLQIEKLIARLRDEELWRNKVTDVRRWFDFAARELDDATGQERGYYEDSTGQSGGEKAKLAFTILVAAIAYQYDIEPGQSPSDRFHFVVVDEMFSKVDDQHAEYALQLFEKFGLQLLIVAPLDAKARVTEPYVGCYLHVVKDPQTHHSEILSMTAREFEKQCAVPAGGPVSDDRVGMTKRPTRPR